MPSVETGDAKYSWLIAGSSAATQYMRTLNSSLEITPTMIIGVSAALWTLIKVIAQVSFRRLLPHEGDKNKIAALADRLVGFSHACAIVPLAFFTVFDTEPQRLCSSYPEYFPFISAFSAGFFVWDLFVCVIQREGVPFTVHAILSLYTYLITTFIPFSYRYAAGFLLFECSTIPYHIPAFAKLVGFNTLDGVFRVIFALSFIMCRIVFGFWWSYKFQVQMLTEDTNLCIPSPMHWSVVLLNLAFNTLNAFWGAKVMQQFLPSNSVKEKKIS